MLSDTRLICTHCDNLVTLGYGYDGYFGTCDCDRHVLSISSGDRPTTWVQLEDATSPDWFTVETEWDTETGQMEVVSVTCTRCGQQDQVTVTTEPLNTSVDYNYKAIFECAREHGDFDHTNTAVAYYNASMPSGEAITRYERNEDQHQ